MRLSKVLYATDFSDSSLSALDCASTLAAAADAEMVIVHVDDTTPGMVVGDIGYGYLPEVDKIAEQELEQLKSVIPTELSVSFKHRFARGSAAEEILKIAEQEAVDLIVIGTHGWTAFSKLLMGSVAEQIVRNANCPVVTVRHNELDQSTDLTAVVEESET